MDYFTQQEEKRSASEEAYAYASSVGASVSKSAAETQFAAEGFLGLREKTAAEQVREGYDAACPGLSYRTRALGFCACLAASFLFALLASLNIKKILKGDPAPFALWDTLTNVVGIAGTFFLSGPTTQCNRMFAGQRLVSTLVYLGALAGTLFFCLAPFVPAEPRVYCIFLMIVVSWLALLWYTLSYVPWAQHYVCAACKSCLGDACCACFEAGGTCEVCKPEAVEATEATPFTTGGLFT